MGKRWMLQDIYVGFFDYITRMPKPSVVTYIENSLEGVQLFEECSNEDEKNFLDFFCDLCQYLFYLTLKYKDVVEFNNIFLKTQITDNIQKVNFKRFPCIKESIGNITTIIEDLEYKIITEQSRGGVRDQKGAFYRIASVENNTIILKRFNGLNLRFTIEISSDTRLNNLLFAPDVKKWEQIKYMEYGHYIHQQLEMFSFIEMDS